MTESEDAFPYLQLRIMQIIVGAMVLSVLAALGVFSFLVFVQNNGQGLAPPGGMPIISAVAVLLIMVNVPLSLTLPGTLVRNSLRQIAGGNWKPGGEANPADFSTDAAKLMAVRLTSLIIASALLEGAGLFGCVAFFVEGQLFVLCVPAFAVLLMLTNFPTESSVRAWLQRQAEQLAELRPQ